MSAAIADGNDLLLAACANDGKREAAGVSRWRRERGDWRPVAFHAISGVRRAQPGAAMSTARYSTRSAEKAKRGKRSESGDLAAADQSGIRSCTSRSCGQTLRWFSTKPPTARRTSRGITRTASARRFNFGR